MSLLARIVRRVRGRAPQWGRRWRGRWLKGRRAEDQRQWP